MVGRVVVVALMLALGCGRFGFDETDPTRFAEPTRLVELSSDFNDRDPVLSADRNLVYFASDRPGGAGGSDLWFATRRAPGEPFSRPQPATELNGVDEDITADLSDDGLTIWFASRREGVSNISILTATRESRDQPFGEPVLTAPLIDTGAGEFSPAVFAGATRMLYASDIDGGSILETRFVAGEWQAPIRRSDLNTEEDDGAPAVFESGLAVVIARGDPVDLVLSTRPAIDAPWGEATPIDELHTGGSDSGASLSNDSLVICFDSDRDGDDIYCSSRVLSGL